MVQDTRTTEENETLVEEMLRDAQTFEPPVETPVIHRGDGELDAPMIVKEMTSAGYVYVWDSRTGEKMPVLYYMLAQKLRTRRPDGSYRFTTKDPKITPYRGKLKCYLHKDHPDRVKMDTLGFRICIKDNITNAHQLTQHMRLKHPQEWAHIEEERKEKERQEDRELQRAILGRVVRNQEESEEVETTAVAVENTTEAPLYVSDKPPKARKKRK